MKNILIITGLFLIISFDLYSIEIKGDTSSRDGYKVIRVWGSHYERGYAYGYLLGKEINDIIKNYLIKSALNGQKTTFSMMKQMFINSFEIDEKYLNEGQGILDGMTASGEAEKLRAYLGWDIDKYDILCGNIIVEFSFLGCSSLALWGDRTEAGNLIYTRNLDWDRSEVLLRNHLLTVHMNQKEDDEQTWVSFGFPGLIGVLSGINFSGVGAFHHMGNYGDVNYTYKPHPIFFSIRNGIELKDYNQDSHCNTADIFHAINDKKTTGGFIINAVNEANTDNNEANVAIVVETDNATGTVYRTKADNTTLNGDIIASTNHFRKLYPMAWCSRYDAIEKITKKSELYDNESAWNDLSSAAGVAYTLQTIQYVPQEGRAYWALANMQTPAYQMKKNVINLFELTDINDFYYTDLDFDIFPNPAKDEITLTNIPEDFEIDKISISDINGREMALIQGGSNNLKINIKKLSVGVYFLNIRGNYHNHKRLIVHKFVVE